MKNISIETTVGEIVRDVPARSRVFENLKIDFCCGGKKPLREVCQAKGLDATTVVAMLSALDNAPDPSAGINPEAMSPAELCDHIEQVHHGYMREELPRLDFMTRKVAAVHGEHEPRLFELRRVFETFSAEMSAHMNEEDINIFPAIRKIDQANEGDAGVLPSLKTALEKLEREHASAGSTLEQFTSLTDHYTPPEWACNTFRAMVDGLEKMEKNMHQHIHKENNVLFPRVLAAISSKGLGNENRKARCCR